MKSKNNLQKYKIAMDYMVAAKCVQNLQSMYRLFNLYIVKELSRTIEEKFIVTSSETKYVQNF